jgi:D-glycero-alpha-D-manno-heptose-7-phosphate kinase
MILSRTPLRISLVGGGSDMKSFYSAHGGAVVSFAISKYVHIAVNEKFDGKTRVSYSETETVDDVKDLKHDIARETLRYYGLSGLEISSLSDIPGSGTGLGSSSSYAVGLSAAITSYMNNGPCASPMLLARGAYHIEHDRCGHPVGMQDQCAAAWGGLHCFTFRPDDTIGVQPIFLDCEKKKYLEDHFMLFYTGITRDASPILQNQDHNMRYRESAIEIGCKMRDMAFSLWGELQKGNFRAIGDCLSEGWALKQQITDGIGSPEINEFYSRAMNAGARGGKLCGAGGGGFLLFWVNQSRRDAVRKAIGLREMPIKIDLFGSRIVYGVYDGRKEEVENVVC